MIHFNFNLIFIFYKKRFYVICKIIKILKLALSQCIPWILISSSTVISTTSRALGAQNVNARSRCPISRRLMEFCSARFTTCRNSRSLGESTPVVRSTDSSAAENQAKYRRLRCRFAAGSCALNSCGRLVSSSPELFGLVCSSNFNICTMTPSLCNLAWLARHE